MVLEDFVCYLKDSHARRIQGKGEEKQMTKKKKVAAGKRRWQPKTCSVRRVQHYPQVSISKMQLLAAWIGLDFMLMVILLRH